MPRLLHYKDQTKKIIPGVEKRQFYGVFPTIIKRKTGTASQIMEFE